MTAPCNEITEVNFIRLKKRITELERWREKVESILRHYEIVKTGY